MPSTWPTAWAWWRHPRCWRILKAAPTRSERVHSSSRNGFRTKSSLTKNPDYWQKGLPYLDEVEFRPSTRVRVRADAMISGQVDVLQAYGGEAIAAGQDAGDDVQVRQIDNGAFLEEYILLNNVQAPFDNIHARRALSFATDRNEFIDVLERGLAQPATGPWSGQDGYPIPDNFPGFDAERAAEELAVYEADTGKPLHFVFLTTQSTASSRQEGELLQDMWGRVGIEVEIIEIETSQWAVSVLTGDYEAVSWGFDGYPDPDHELPFWHSESALPIGESASNFGRFKNPMVDELMIRARGTIDEDERRGLYAEVAQIIIDEVPWVYTDQELPLLATRSSVEGLGSFPLPDGGEGVEIIQGVVRPTTLLLAD